MEKNKNISLDELFARAKGEEPVISQEDVRTIVSSATSPVQSIKTTTSIISRKGFIMTGLGLIGATAALVGYLSLGTSNVIPRVSSTEESGISSLPTQTPHVVRGDIAETTTPTNEPKKDVKVAKKIIIVRDNGDGTELAINPNVPEPLMPPIPPLLPDGKLMAPVEVQSIGIYQAKDEDLAKLGLQKAPNGDLLYKGAIKGGTVMTINIPAKGWGVTSNMQTRKEASTDVKLTPMIITDARGNKRFINYSDENTMLHMQRFQSNMPGGFVIDGDKIPNISIQNDEANIMINSDRVVDGKQLKSNTRMRKKIMISHDSTSANDASDIHKMNMQIFVDESDGDKKNFNFNMKFDDSTMDMSATIKEAMSKAQEAMKSIRVEMDSAHKSMINIQLDKNFNWNGNLQGFDSTVKNLDNDMSSIIIMDKNYSPEEVQELDQNVLIGMPGIDGEIKAIEVKLTAMINTLVPVLVRKATEVTHNDQENRDYDNGVIIWLEPTKELYAALPNQYEVVLPSGMKLVGGTSHLATNAQDKQSDIAKQVVSNTTVYPNPVRTSKTNIHYKLSEPRSVAFSIHDILGKKIVDCGSLAERPQGEYDFELNIGSIPAGIYLVVITTDKGEQTIQRIAVEK